MKVKVNLVTIWTNHIDKMKNFYNQVLGFKIKMTLEIMLNLKMRE